MLDPISLAVLAFFKGNWAILGFGVATVKAYFTAKKVTGQKFELFRADLDKWVSKLLDNHLAHIEDSTGKTVTETKKTNELLVSAALNDAAIAKKVDLVAETLREHREQQNATAQGIITQLTLLEDRTRRNTPRPKPRARRKA